MAAEFPLFQVEERGFSAREEAWQPRLLALHLLLWLLQLLSCCLLQTDAAGAKSLLVVALLVAGVPHYFAAFGASSAAFASSLLILTAFLRDLQSSQDWGTVLPLHR